MAIGTGNLPYQTSTVSPFDIILAQTTNEMIANINALATGTGLGDNSVTASQIADGAVTIGKVADGVLDLKSKMILLTRDGTANAGDVSYTGVGFRPTSIHFFMAVAGTSYHSKGASDANKDARCLFCAGNNVFYPADRPVIYSNQTAWAQSAYIKSYDEDGFTLTWSKTGTPPAGTLTIMALCYQ